MEKILNIIRNNLLVFALGFIIASCDGRKERQQEGENMDQDTLGRQDTLNQTVPQDTQMHIPQDNTEVKPDTAR